MNAHSALLLSGGEVLVSGSGFYVSHRGEPGHAFLWVARVTASGALDSSFGDGGIAYVYEAEGPGLIEPDGSGLALLGSSKTSAGFRMAAWGLIADGAVNPAFGSDGAVVIPTIAGYNECALAAATVDQAGRLLLTGTEREPGGALLPVPSIARLTPAGQLDPSFGEGGQTLGPQNSDFDALTIDPQGRIVAAGTQGEPLDTGSGHEYSLVERFLSENTSPSAPTPAPSGGGNPSFIGSSAGETPGSPGVGLGTTASTTGPSVAPSPGVSAAEIAALLAQQSIPSGKKAKIAASIEHGFSFSFKSVQPGKAVVDWYEVDRATKRTKTKLILIASGKLTFKGAQTATITLRLTNTGRRLLAHDRRLGLIARATFTPTGKAPIEATRNFILHR